MLLLGTTLMVYWTFLIVTAKSLDAIVRAKKTCQYYQGKYKGYFTIQFQTQLSSIPTKSNQVWFCYFEQGLDIRCYYKQGKDDTLHITLKFNDRRWIYIFFKHG